MGLRIATNIASQNVQKNLKEVSAKGDSELEKLSSGKRITKFRKPTIAAVAGYALGADGPTGKKRSPGYQKDPE